MRNAPFDGSFAGWRTVARSLLQQGIAPHQVNWQPDGDSLSLFDQSPTAADLNATKSAPCIPRQLLEQLESAACFRMEDRWSLLYRILWRVAHGDRAAMLPGDIDGSQLHKRLVLRVRDGAEPEPLNVEIAQDGGGAAKEGRRRVRGPRRRFSSGTFRRPSRRHRGS